MTLVAKASIIESKSDSSSSSESEQEEIINDSDESTDEIKNPFIEKLYETITYLTKSLAKSKSGVKFFLMEVKDIKEKIFVDSSTEKLQNETPTQVLQP